MSWPSFILQSTAVWYLISPSLAVHSTNVLLWFIPHSAGLYQQALQLRAAAWQQNKKVPRLLFCLVVSLTSTLLLCNSQLYRPWPLSGCHALLAFISAVATFLFFSQNPSKARSFGLSQWGVTVYALHHVTRELDLCVHSLLVACLSGVG